MLKRRQGETYREWEERKVFYVVVAVTGTLALIALGYIIHAWSLPKDLEGLATSHKLLSWLEVSNGQM